MGDLVALEREVIALAARGLLAAVQLAAMPLVAFTGAPRLFAWTCAARACRLFGEFARFIDARHMLATSPRLDLPFEIWRDLMRETEQELDAAERNKRSRDEAYEELLRTADVL